MNPLPIPHDIPLPLPADRGFLEAVLVVLFLAHILFVNFMVGGTLLAVAAEALGLKNPAYDRLARQMAATITVNKSLAVVLGVGPLLTINVLYTVWFYTANGLTGGAWLAIVPLVTAAFLFSYLWKYTWDSLAHAKGLHLGLGLLPAALFLFVPLIFLANVNLMLFPQRWAEVHGFLSALLLPNALVRYLHFLLASLAVAGLFYVVWFTRASYPLEERLPGLTRAGLRRGFYGVTFAATLGQLIAGPSLLFTLPNQGWSWAMLLLIGLGVTFAAIALLVLWGELTRAGDAVGGRYGTVVILLTGTVLCMGYGRHLYRETALGPHMRAVAEKTDAYRVALAAATALEASGSAGAAKKPPGQQIFETTCAACHALDTALVGPSVIEIADIYADDPAGIPKWVRAPGRKRAGFSAMPAFPMPQAKLEAVASYLIEVGEAAQAPGEAP
ncbi:MAG: cytochrome c [Pseudomonadota bacterium]